MIKKAKETKHLEAVVGQTLEWEGSDRTVVFIVVEVEILKDFRHILHGIAIIDNYEYDTPPHHVKFSDQSNIYNQVDPETIDVKDYDYIQESITYKRGQWFEFENEKYILVVVGPQKEITLINAENGNRWKEPIIAKNTLHITQEEVNKLIGFRKRKFTPIPTPDF